MIFDNSNVDYMKKINFFGKNIIIQRKRKGTKKYEKNGRICYILAFIPFQAGSMVEDIRNAFKELLMESRWMNRATQVISCVNNRYMYIQKILYIPGAN